MRGHGAAKMGHTSMLVWRSTARSCVEGMLRQINSSAGKANYYGTHVVQEIKVLRVAGKRS